MRQAIRLGIGIAIGQSLYRGLCFLTGLWACGAVGLLWAHQWLLAAGWLAAGVALNRVVWRRLG